MAQFATFLRNSFRRRSSAVRENNFQATAKENVLLRGNKPEGKSLHFPGGQFFEYLVVVSLKRKRPEEEYQPEITYQFPKRENLLKSQKEEEERLLKAIPLFSFPDGITWAPLSEYTSETFSFVLTNVDGSRKFGYCRRLLGPLLLHGHLQPPPPAEKAHGISRQDRATCSMPQLSGRPFWPSGKGARLPIVYCIISCLGCFGLFSKILEEVEKRHQIATAVIYPFMQALRETPFPAPGKTVTVKSFIPDSGTEFIELTRPLDSRLEHVDFRILIQRVTCENILCIFASAVLERRIIFLAEELSVLSQCTHAVAALLYPFKWEHTFIPVLPRKLIDTVCCPTPFMVGVQTQWKDQVLDMPMEEVLLVDLYEGKLLKKDGDEEYIVPPKLQNEMLISLTEQKNATQTPEQVNKNVSDTFMHFFVRTVGHYTSHIKRSRNEPPTFQEKTFCQDIKSKSIRRFVKKLVKTQMFSIFIQEAEKSPASQEGYFQQKVIEYQRLKKLK
ncbi:DENN domain-containing protein 2D isoform X1 [Pleurodeles waltl]|uniref:DENN domain-containing protein 2D isoform X1 n=1 Tax=Pleurodeles waltl TaxID=8319 RepID=UPI0037099981